MCILLKFRKYQISPEINLKRLCFKLFHQILANNSGRISTSSSFWSVHAVCSRIEKSLKSRKRFGPNLEFTVSVFPHINHLPLTFEGRMQINKPITVIDFIMKVTWTN